MGVEVGRNARRIAIEPSRFQTLGRPRRRQGLRLQVQSSPRVGHLKDAHGGVLGGGVRAMGHPEPFGRPHRRGRHRNGQQRRGRGRAPGESRQQGQDQAEGPPTAAQTGHGLRPVRAGLAVAGRGGHAAAFVLDVVSTPPVFRVSVPAGIGKITDRGG